MAGGSFCMYQMGSNGMKGMYKNYFMVLLTDCRANMLYLSREPNAGSGPVDFKLSKGYNAKVNLEVKLSTNSGLIHGFEKQLPIYDKAEQSHYSIFLVIVMRGAIKINKMRIMAKNQREQGLRTPTMILIDGKKTIFCK